MEGRKKMTKITKTHKRKEDVECYDHPRTDGKGEMEVEVEPFLRCEIV